MVTPLKIRLHVLSPMHIGCDDVYEPTSFAIDTNRRKLIAFDPLRFIQTLDEKERKEFLSISQKGTLPSIIEVYRFIHKHGARLTGHEVDVVQEVIDRYLKVKSMPLEDRKIKQELNFFVLPRTAYHPRDNRPYIPGSSLKGALRTGYLSMLAFAGGTDRGIHDILSGKQPTGSIRGRNDARLLEKELLGGSFSEDPFRMVKVSDLAPIKDMTPRIVFGINRKKEADTTAKGIPTIFETIQPGAVFEGMLNVEVPPPNSGIQRPIIPTTLFLLAHKHYARVFNTEFKIAKVRNFRMPSFKAFEDKLKKTAYLIRVGRHSGAEAVTIEGNRMITVRGPGGSREIKDHATTIWLASDKSNPRDLQQTTPFGWAVMEVVN